MKTKLRKGTKVLMYSCDMKKKLGIGEYIGSENLGFIEPLKQIIKTPKFKIGKKIIRGYECWWIIKSEAEKIEKDVLMKQEKK